MFQLGLFRIRAFAAGNLASLMGSIARGGLQFMLIIWLQGIWLPLHGYDFADTPLRAGHLPAAADRWIPDSRADLGLPVRPVRPAAVRDHGPAGIRRRVRRPATPAGRIPLLDLRSDHLVQRPRIGAVCLAEHVGDHEQRACQVPGRCLGHAVDVSELRHVPVDRHLLLADDRRARGLAPAHPQFWPARARSSRAGCGPRRQPAAGKHAVRVIPRLQPDRHPAPANGSAQQRCPGPTPRC